ncbi:MAG: starch [Rhodospirillaceae bacterium]|nr:MAG: starch [Rhodospirillaceae bacterium]TNC97112.1 MAG: starch synthase [Stygiobacter sp.]
MRVLFAASEVFPLVKTGGLADVAGALPAALIAAGHEVRVLLPGYPQAMERAEGKRQVASFGDPLGVGAEIRLVSAKLPGSALPVWLLDCPALYARDGGPYVDAKGIDYADNPLRFGLLSWVAARLCMPDSPVKWRPQVLHCHDWQTGLAPAYLHAWKPEKPVSTVFTIHNIAYQGQFPVEWLPRLGLPWDMFTVDGLEYWGDLSFLKAGLVYADKLTTVSPRYAREIQTPGFGCGLDGVLMGRAGDLTGILNGADYGVWNPATDSHLVQTYPPRDHRIGKAVNKAGLQQALGLDKDDLAPLLVIVSRLTDQKGMDMVLSTLPAILRQGAQLAVLGAGDRSLEQGFQSAAAGSPRRMSVTIGYSEELAHRLLAAGDILVMPSRFEPCGLTQFYAMRYGTVPLVHATGGLADTVMDCSYDGLVTGTGTGFVFEYANAGAFQWCVERAITAFHDPDQWRRIQAAGIAQDFGWDRSAARYGALYAELVNA